jgi:hypothetical protein
MSRLLLLFCFFILACRPVNYTCVCFTNDKTWANYQKDEEVFFKEKKSIQTPFVLKKISLIDGYSNTEDYSFNEKNRSFGGAVKCRCDYSVKDKQNNFYLSVTSDVTSSKVVNGKNVLIKPDMQEIFLSLNDFGVSLRSRSSYLVIEDSLRIQVLKNQTIGNTMYEEVINLTMDTITNPKQNYWKIIWAKNHGMVSFSTRFPREDWIKH